MPNKFPSLRDDHPRVVIPFYDRAGNFFAFQGRAFGKEQPKYITIKFDDTKEIYLWWLCPLSLADTPNTVSTRGRDPQADPDTA